MTPVSSRDWEGRGRARPQLAAHLHEFALEMNSFQVSQLYSIANPVQVTP